MPHGPEPFASHFMASVPCRIQQDTANYMAKYMSVSLLCEQMNNMFKFAQFLCLELDSAHYLGDDHQATVMSRIDKLSVKINSLQGEQKHLINEHWIPLQQFASGVVAHFSVLAGMDPAASSPLFCSKCGRGDAPAQPQGEDELGCVTSIPVGLVSDNLKAFGIHPSNFPSPIFTFSSVLLLISIFFSSSEEPLLYSPSSSPCSLVSTFFRDPSVPSYWSDHLIAAINTLDILTY